MSGSPGPKNRLTNQDLTKHLHQGSEMQALNLED